MNVNIQFVFQFHQTIHYYLVLGLKKENVYHLIIAIVIQDIIHLIVHYIIAVENYLMILLFVLEMGIVFQQKLVIVIMDILLKTVKLKCVIQFLQI
jgi:ABC-type iron transport system FetAB permease component